MVVHHHQLLVPFLLLNNDWDGYKKGQACAVGILMDVKAGNTVTVAGSVTGACIIFAID